MRYNNNNNMTFHKRNNIDDRERKSKTLNKGRTSIKDEYNDNSDNNSIYIHKLLFR